MSTATLVPETRDLKGDDAWAVLRRSRPTLTLKDAFMRMRAADGFSHARSLAFMTALVTIQGVIGLVGLASVLDKGGVSQVIVRTLQGAVPGPVGLVLVTAVNQAHRAGAAHDYTAVILGLLGWLITATTAMGQVERGVNRLYGVEKDRPTLQKYGLGLLFAVSVGTLTSVAFACIAFGRDLFHPAANSELGTVWTIVSWPVGLGLILLAVTMLFRYSPRRRQPRLSWLAFGSGISVLLWMASTAGLGYFYRSSGSFGHTYGPLVGLVALLVWCLFSGISLFFGAAVSAQLEAIRAGHPVPQDLGKVLASEPDARPVQTIGVAS